MTTQTNKTHPILIIAAIAVTLFSVIGISAIMGWIPGSFSKSGEQPVSPSITAEQTAKLETTAPKSEISTAETPKSEAVAPVLATPQQAEVKPEVHKQVHKEKHPRKVAQYNDVEQARKYNDVAPVTAKTCANCGEIESVNAIEQPGEGTGLGAVAGGVAGALLGPQIGQGRGTTAATIAGAAGGAYAGHQVEKSMKKARHYEISVRMEDGSYRTITQQSDSGLMSGDKVKIVDGAIVRN